MKIEGKNYLILFLIVLFLLCIFQQTIKPTPLEKINKNSLDKKIIFQGTIKKIYKYKNYEKIKILENEIPIYLNTKTDLQEKDKIEVIGKIYQINPVKINVQKISKITAS